MQKTSQPDRAVPRSDAWESLFADLKEGVRDRASGLRWFARARMPESQLEALYEQNAIAARVVDKIVDDSMREGWELKLSNEDTEKAEAQAKAIKSWLSDLGFDFELIQAEKWGRLYGGALLCSATIDYDPITGEIRKPDEPMGVVAHVYRPFVIPRRDAIPLAWDTVYGSPTYHKVLAYHIVNESGRQITLHHSRCHVVEPIPLPPSSARQREWGPSVLERPFDAIARYGASLQHGTSMMFIASLLHMMLEGYRADYVTKGGPERLRLRLAEMFRTIDSRGALVMDSKDQIGSTSLSMSGATDMVDRNRDAMASDTNMPREVALNESPAGLNAGELSGPLEMWYGSCGVFQKNELVPAIDWFLRIALQTQKGISDWKVEFPPLWVKDDAAKADTAGKWANVDKTYFDMGADGPAIIDARLVQGVTGPLELTDDAPVGNPLDLTGEEIGASEQAAAAPAAPVETPADTAMNGAQISSLLEIMKAVNIGELTYEQGIGALGTAFPNLREKEVTILGPKPAVAPVNPNAPVPVAQTGDQVQTDEPDPMNGPSDDPIPPDVLSPREAAEKYRVSTRTITRMMETGGIRFWGLGSHVRVSLADIAKAARSHEKPAAETVTDAYATLRGIDDVEMWEECRMIVDAT